MASRKKALRLSRYVRRKDKLGRWVYRDRDTGKPVKKETWQAERDLIRSYDWIASEDGHSWQATREEKLKQEREAGREKEERQKEREKRARWEQERKAALAGRRARLLQEREAKAAETAPKPSPPEKPPEEVFDEPPDVDFPEDIEPFEVDDVTYSTGEK